MTRIKGYPRFVISPVLVLVITIASCSDVAAQDAADWPHIRGPSYNGNSNDTGLADAWPEEGPPVLWIRDIGQGYSGFVVSGDRVFTQGQTLYGQYVYCLDADSGETLWQYRYDSPYDHAGIYPGPRATPTYHSGRVFFAGPRGRLGCLDATTGRMLWSVDLNKVFGVRGADFGYSCSPLIHDDLVIMPVGGENASVVALAVQDGSTVWTSGSEPASYCGVIPVSLDGRSYGVAHLQNALAVFELQTGRQVWKRLLSRGYDEHAAWPLYDEPYLVTMAPFRAGAKMFRLESGGEDEGDSPCLRVERVWDVKEMSNDTASSVLVDGHIFGFDLRDVQTKPRRPSRGKFKCMELATGKVRWETDATGHATVLAADGKLILFNDRGELSLATRNPERYEELARSPMFRCEICWTVPALYRGRLYARSPTKAACVFLGEADRLSAEQQAVATPSSLTPQPTRFDLLRLLGGEREYPFDPPDGHELRLWYIRTLLGVFLPAGVLGICLQMAAQIRWPLRSAVIGRTAFWCSAFLLGIAATPIWNRVCDEFVFTWPGSLAVALQVQILVILWSRRHKQDKRAGRLSLVGAIGFIAVLVGYFQVCRLLGMAMQWVYIPGLILGFVIATPVGFLLARWGRPLSDWLGAMASFTIYFWASSWLLWWLLD